MCFRKFHFCKPDMISQAKHSVFYRLSVISLFARDIYFFESEKNVSYMVLKSQLNKIFSLFTGYCVKPQTFRTEVFAIFPFVEVCTWLETKFSFHSLMRACHIKQNTSNRILSIQRNSLFPCCLFWKNSIN